jgi:hypothetical protein
MTTCTANNSVTEFDISGLEAMLAGTLCLMSAYSHCHCQSGKDGSNNQGLIGLKIVSNLTCLQYQNSLSPEFRRVLSKVCESWRQHSMLTLAENPQDTHWHQAPSTVQ